VTVGKAYSTVTVDNTMDVHTMGDYSRGVIIEVYANATARMPSAWQQPC